MTKAERLRALASALDNQSVMRLRDAATLLGVSEMTVRRDIAASPGRFTYLGGYIVSAADVPNAAGYTIDEEKDHFAQAKAEASAAAAKLLVDSETVFIDCGTTLTTLARQIPAEMHLTVVCYSLNVAEILRRRPNVRMILLGGVYVPSSDSFASDESVETLRRMGINKAFLSAGGVDEARGVTCWNFHEVAIKQAAMASAVERHLVVDASKFGKVKAVRFSQLDEFDSVITEKGQARRGQ
ncbi:DeoR family transcriptional regulator [Caballeronia terrestris]|jgi:DeoR family deoxyribose operon repressor|uniref:DeoR family transcriptional regulator n=1 Tax=Caballeronia terrestris TaxID=1226301 RepID=A0A158FVV6_9BURK|nr:DeoR/GlpR family DNA-binding transcription regulator [Caballeronia terrestris]SAL23763.1 DeoR family transcriptional regulator [Caballeronia terrestris]